MIRSHWLAFMGGRYDVRLSNHIMPEMAACPLFNSPLSGEKPAILILNPSQKIGAENYLCGLLSTLSQGKVADS